MAMYYLSQSGDVQGPFGEGRILEMADAGEIGTGAQVALHGSEDWFAADDLLSTLWGERKEREALERRNKGAKRAKRIGKGGAPLWLRIFLGIIAVVLLVSAVVTSRENDRDFITLKTSLRERADFVIALTKDTPVVALRKLRSRKERLGRLSSHLRPSMEALEIAEEMGKLNDAEGHAAILVGLLEASEKTKKSLQNMQANHSGQLLGARVAAGLIFLLLAVIPYKRKYLCSSCGNSVEKTSSVCPSCQCSLTLK